MRDYIQARMRATNFTPMNICSFTQSNLRGTYNLKHVQEMTSGSADFAGMDLAAHNL